MVGSEHQGEIGELALNVPQAQAGKGVATVCPYSHWVSRSTYFEGIPFDSKILLIVNLILFGLRLPVTIRSLSSPRLREPPSN